MSFPISCPTSRHHAAEAAKAAKQASAEAASAIAWLMPQYAKAAKAKLKHLNRFCEVCEAARIECTVPKPAQTWQVVSGLSKPAGYEGGVPIARHVALTR